MWGAQPCRSGCRCFPITEYKIELGEKTNDISSRCAILWVTGMSGLVTHMLELPFSNLDLEMIKHVNS